MYWDVLGYLGVCWDELRYMGGAREGTGMPCQRHPPPPWDRAWRLPLLPPYPGVTAGDLGKQRPPGHVQGGPCLWSLSS